MKIIILGSKGMLGQMAEKYFRQNYQVICINDRYSPNDRCSLINKINESGDGYIINCIGRIVQKSTDTNELYFINTILPLDIYENKLDSQILIQPSTDCIFNGKTDTKYKKDDKSNAEDDYGCSKRLGELALENKKNAYIIRVSIIGIDLIDPNPKGLLGWFLSQENGTEIKGYADHFWNGITTLEWCKGIEKIIFQNKNEINNTNIIQLGTKSEYSKYDILNMFNQIYNKQITIKKYFTNAKTYKCLEPDYNSKDFFEQVIEMRDFVE